MQTQIIDGKKLRDEILAEVKKGVAYLSFQPVFCDILVGKDPVSAQYVRMKTRMAEASGIKFHNVSFPESISEESLIQEIKKINELPNMCGLIIQLPLPKKFEKQKILDAVFPTIDIDCLSQETSTLFYKDLGTLCFPTALACMHILDSLNIDLIHKKIVVLGQGILVGKPVTHLLKKRGLDVSIINRETEEKDKKIFIKNADIIISATGEGKIIRGDMIKKNAIIIDAGTSESEGGITGDVDIDSVLDIASFVSPVPGGVGPVTVAMLLRNVLQVAKSKSK